MSDTEQQPLTDAERDRWRELVEIPFEDLSDEEITSKIRLSVKRRFSHPEWVLMFEYGAPGASGRVADAIAVNTLPSRNYKVVAFEFKASRSDWLREKRDGEKADYFVRMADEFYLVAPKGVVEESEIPEGWGYLELKPNSEQLYKLRDSELTEHQQGDPRRRFWIRFMQQTVGEESNYTETDLQEAKKRGYEEAKEEGISKFQQERHVDELKRKAENWEQLHEAGFDFVYRLDEADIETLELGYQLAKELERGGITNLRGQVETLQDMIERDAERMLDRLDTLDEGMETMRERIERGDTPVVADGGDD